MTAVVSLGVLLMMSVAVIMDVVRGNPVPEELEVVNVLFFVGGIASHLVQLVGAIAMFRVRGPTWAMLAVAASFNPCNFYCCWIPFPFAVWGAVVLADPYVRAAFVRESPEPSRPC